jgi:hypothetical protein
MSCGDNDGNTLSARPATNLNATYLSFDSHFDRAFQSACRRAMMHCTANAARRLPPARPSTWQRNVCWMSAARFRMRIAFLKKCEKIALSPAAAAVGAPLTLCLECPLLFELARVVRREKPFHLVHCRAPHCCVMSSLDLDFNSDDDFDLPLGNAAPSSGAAANYARSSPTSFLIIPVLIRTCTGWVSLRFSCLFLI